MIYIKDITFYLQVREIYERSRITWSCEQLGVYDKANNLLWTPSFIGDLTFLICHCIFYFWQLVLWEGRARLPCRANIRNCSIQYVLNPAEPADKLHVSWLMTKSPCVVLPRLVREVSSVEIKFIETA